MTLTMIEIAKILLDTVWRVGLLTLFAVVRLVYVNVQRMLWRCSGTLRQLEESAYPENFERSVQVLDILFYHSFDWTLPVAVDHFLLVHNRFESPSYILDNDHVTLMTLTETHAVFGEAQDRDMHLWKTQFGAFLKLAQIRYCNRLLLVPLQVFHRLSETVGDPEGQLVFLHSTGRCGSTLVVQMLNATDRIVAVSEPDVCNVLWSWQLKKKKQQQKPLVPINLLHKDVIRFICRPYKTIRPLAYLVKFPSFYARHMRFYQELFPSSRQLFMYRNALSVIKSQFRMMMGMTPGRLQAALIPLFPARLSKHLLLPSRIFEERFISECSLKDSFLMGLIMFIESTVHYIESRQQGLDIEAIRYEDIVYDPMEACKRILDFCGVPESLSTRAVDGMRADSQRCSLIAKTAVQHYKCPDFGPEFRKNANRLLRKHGLPDIDEDVLLEGTITQRNESKTVDFQV